jgi:hypothetical protein
MEQVYMGGGTEQHYLADLPAWANFSAIGSCRRIEPVRFLNFQTLHKSYSMSYEQLVQFQYMLNRKFQSFKKSTGKKQLFLKDESYIFYNVYEQIIGGGKDFIVPKFNRVHLVWIDDALSDKDVAKKLHKLMKTAKMEEGHPVFVSSCLSAIELEKFIVKHGYEKMGVKAISQEMFAPFDHKNNLIGEYRLHFDLLMPGKDLVLFGNAFPKEFKGVSQYKKF